MPDDSGVEGSGLLSVEAALKVLVADVAHIAEVEEVELGLALGRVLAQPIVSSVNVPPWRNSAMDGYAINSGDVIADAATCLPVTQRIAAGSMGERLVPGSAARIFTGAPVPSGADAVVQQEHCRAEGEGVVIEGAVKPGDHIRMAGEDIRAGAEILAAGTRLRPQELGLAASVGVAAVPVYRRLRVAVLCTGNELARPGAALAPGQIYDSNRFLLVGLVQALGCKALDLGVIGDEPEVTVKRLQQAAEMADLVLTSGGVSVGEEDHVRAAVQSLGSLELWRVAIKPGKPLAFGQIDETPFLGLPGNPVSCFLGFCLFARPHILRRQGLRAVLPEPRPVRAGFHWKAPDKRCEYLRARLEKATDGGSRAVVYPRQGSAVLSSVVWADGIVEIPAGVSVQPGDSVSYIAMTDLLCP